MRLGDWDLRDESAAEYHGTLEAAVGRARAHPEWDPGTGAADLAVLILEWPVDFDEFPHVRPVCLPGNPRISFIRQIHLRRSRRYWSMFQVISSFSSWRCRAEKKISLEHICIKRIFFLRRSHEDETYRCCTLPLSDKFDDFIGSECYVAGWNKAETMPVNELVTVSRNFEKPDRASPPFGFSGTLKKAEDAQDAQDAHLEKRFNQSSA